MTTMDKRRKFNWIEIQEYYQIKLCTLNELCDKFGMTRGTIHKAVVRGEFKSRNNSDALKLSNLRGRINSGETGRRNRGKIARTIQKKVKNGTWHVSLAKNMWKTYNGNKLHGNWEVEYAKWLDRNGITWRRPTETFQYEFQGKKRRYTPDFYLADEQTYVEVKGYETEKDRAKWIQFPLKHKVIKEDDLRRMGIIN